jgi:hypothetical protein
LTTKTLLDNHNFQHFAQHDHLFFPTENDKKTGGACNQQTKANTLEMQYSLDRKEEQHTTSMPSLHCLAMMLIWF